MRIWKDFDFESFYANFNKTKNNPKRDHFKNLLENTKLRTKKNKLKNIRDWLW